MKYVPITMIHQDIRTCPSYTIPLGWGFRTWQPNDEQVWAEIATKAGEFASMDQALDYFTREFINDPNNKQQLPNRCVFLTTNNGHPIGTAMGWYNPHFLDRAYGRLHWVSIIPEYQGRGLAKPLVSQAITILQAHHSKAYLTTQTTSYKAVKIYLDFGFHPYIHSDQCNEGWMLLSNLLRHPALDNRDFSF